MKAKIFYSFLALMVVAAVAPHSVMAAGATKVDLVQDVAAGSGDLADMVGPTGFGFVNFNQNAAGDLRVTVSVKNAEPNTEYSGMFLVCGPTHATGCGFVDIGDVTTNGQGNGNATLHLTVDMLQASPFGPGARTDHFDLLGPAGDVYTASGINYVVP